MAVVGGREGGVVDETHAVSVALVTQGVRPVGRDREAREPADEGISYTPYRRKVDQEDADLARLGAGVEEPQVLKEERELDQGGRAQVRGVREVEDVEEVGELVEGDAQDVLAQAEVGTCCMSVWGLDGVRGLWLDSLMAVATENMVVVSWCASCQISRIEAARVV